jgi:hypothetical protein
MGKTSRNSIKDVQYLIKEIVIEAHLFKEDERGNLQPIAMFHDTGELKNYVDSVGPLFVGAGRKVYEVCRQDIYDLRKVIRNKLTVIAWFYSRDDARAFVDKMLTIHVNEKS